jgi:hypothetical protein
MYGGGVSPITIYTGKSIGAAHMHLPSKAAGGSQFQRERAVMALSHAPVTIPSRKMRTNVRSMNVFIERSWRCSRTCRNAALEIPRLTQGSLISFGHSDRTTRV